jgi:pyridoxamine-phosphate oxidase
MDIDSEARRTDTGVSIFDVPPDNPLTVLSEWFSRAAERNIQEPGAMSLATADLDCLASNRIVQLLEIRAGQLVFASHAYSQKGREMAATGWASGVLYWRETKQQIIVSGPVGPLSSDESDVLWAKRPLETNAMSVASRQSAILEDEDGLRRRARSLARLGIRLTRPDGWIGYGLMPRFIEFWQFSADRLHRRLRYEAHPEGWTHCRLQP